MDTSKSKPVTTSVPSISIKFHANAEEIEELYASDNEAILENNPDKLPFPSPGASVSSIGEYDTSRLKYFPKLGKRATSIDVSPGAIDNSPPSDPWRFFSDIKGKITKSVEEKITEIKARNIEEGSPLHKAAKNESKTVKDSKESSSVSDSEDLSESSISRTCGVISTTEGVEMSSDEDTPSLDKDKKLLNPVTSSTLKRKFRLFRSKHSAKEGTVKINNLSKLYNINADKVDQALPEHSEEVESGVDALEDFKDVNEDNVDESCGRTKIDNDKIVKSVEDKYHNIEVDFDDVVNVKEVTGKDIRQSFFSNEEKFLTVFAPTGFVDVRPTRVEKLPDINYYWSWIALLIAFTLYVILHRYNSYSAGFLAGVLLTMFIVKVCLKFYVQAIGTNNISTMVPSTVSLSTSYYQCQRIAEIQAIQEYQPLTKFEGWANEYPDIYTPETYHISRTQSVFLRLQGNLLRISHSKSKIPKRAMWNEKKIKATFTHHRIYNLMGAKIKLLPVGLTKKRLWSKKYPICIVLNKDQMNFDPEVFTDVEDEKGEKSSIVVKKVGPKVKKKFTFKKKEYPALVRSKNKAQRFSKLNEGDDFDLDSDSRASTPSPENSDGPVENFLTPNHPDDTPVTTEVNNEDNASLFDELHLGSSDVSITNNQKLLSSKIKTKEASNEIRIYIFGRTDREKEDWFRRFAVATHNNTSNLEQGDTDDRTKVDISKNVELCAEYLKYMMLFTKPSKKLSTQEKHRTDSEKSRKNSDKPRKDSDKPKIDFLPKKDAKKDDKCEKDSDIHESDHSDELETPKKPKFEEVLWFNALIGRVLFDCVRDPIFTLRIKDRIQRKLGVIKLPYFIEELLVTELSLGKTPPFIHRTSKPVLDERGLWVDMDITYEGSVVLTLQTKLNLMRLKNPQFHEKPPNSRPAMYYSDVDDTAESSTDSEGPQELHLVQDGTALSTTGSSSNSGKKIIKMVDRIAESKFFQAATENRYIKKAMEGVSNTDLRLTVELRALSGTMVLNIPPPPSDRLWIGFKPVPEIMLSARPIVGERNINYTMVTSWVEKKLIQEFQKILVIPNMDDFVIPVMNPKLPE